MKNILFVLIILFASTTLSTNAQGVTDKAKQASTGLNILPISDIGGTANGILGLLKPKLALSDAQSPKVTGLLTDFLKSKSGILGLAQSNPADYKSKFEGIQDKLFGGFKTIVSGAQYTKLLGLKPKASDTGNLLNHLFF